MRILWLCNQILPEHADLLNRPPSVYGGWLSGLLNELRKNPELTLGIASSFYNGRFSEKKCENVTFYTVPCHPNQSLTPELIQCYRKIAEDFRPDVIHIHGSEYYHGLLSALGYLTAPAVLSVQGIVTGCAAWCNGNLFQSELPFSLKEKLLGRSLDRKRRTWEERAVIEQKIFSGITRFCGRTAWDEAYVRRLNPDARYYHVGEILRPEFYSSECVRTRNRVVPHSIFSNFSNDPLKGGHILLKAVGLLKSKYPDVSVTATGSLPQTGRLKRFVLGNSYQEYLRRCIEDNGLSGHVRFANRLTAAEIRQALQAHSVCVSASFIDNSPNMIGEAQLTGCPVTASAAGGVPDMISHEKTGLLFPVGDPYLLADRLDRLWQSESLSDAISANAMEAASGRHNPTSIYKDQLKAYYDTVTHS